MGKYMRKAKSSREVAVVEMPYPSLLGVRTRAKTLALQRLEKCPKAAEDSSSSSSYLQLRSRRLEKHSVVPARKPSLRSINTQFGTENKVGDSSTNSGSAQMNGCCSGKMKGIELSANVAENVFEVSMENGGIEVSFGENVPDYESCRKSRETTPCSLIRDPESISTPGSTTRQTTMTVNTRRMRPSTTCHMPTAQEIDEFFRGPEQAQQRKFAQKYNFDLVNEQPLPGRYEWEKMDA